MGRGCELGSHTDIGEASQAKTPNKIGQERPFLISLANIYVHTYVHTFFSMEMPVGGDIVLLEAVDNYSRGQCDDRLKEEVPAV